MSSFQLRLQEKEEEHIKERDEVEMHRARDEEKLMIITEKKRKKVPQKQQKRKNALKQLKQRTLEQQTLEQQQIYQLQVQQMKEERQHKLQQQEQEQQSNKDEEGEGDEGDNSYSRELEQHNRQQQQLQQQQQQQDDIFTIEKENILNLLLESSSTYVRSRRLENLQRVTFGFWIIALCRLWRSREAVERLVTKRRKRCVYCCF